jgi:adenine/guanine phosphoribosyltransferase-like PRPP-binding protein
MTQSKILKTIEKELNIVPKNHFWNLWMILGMSAFGFPLGVAFALSIDNLAFIGIGLPVGMVHRVGCGYIHG